MEKKRPFSSVSESPQQSAPGNKFPASRPVKMSRKPHRQAHHRTGGSAAVPGVGIAKKRARAIQRLFQKGDVSLPENVRVDLERELVGLSSTIHDREYQKQRSKMISKYHMVRFFERKKAERLVKRLRSRINEASDPGEAQSLRADLHVAEVDVNYTKYHPHLEPYIGLYPKSSKDDGDRRMKDSTKPSAADSSAVLSLRSERPSIWKEVEQATEEGEDALVRLRERRHSPFSAHASDARFRSSMGAKHKPSHTKQNLSGGAGDARYTSPANRDNEGTDRGGFFDQDD